MKPTCQNCGHSMERDPANVWCRRYPPAMAFVQVGKTSMLTIPGGGQAAQIQGEWISTFPSMQKTAPGCGEWKQDPETYVDAVDMEQQESELARGD